MWRTALERLGSWSRAGGGDSRAGRARVMMEGLEGRVMLTAVQEMPEPATPAPNQPPVTQVLSGAEEYDISGNVQYAGDRDAYQFTVSAGATVTVSLGSESHKDVSVSVVTQEHRERPAPDTDTYLLGGLMGEPEAQFTASKAQVVVLKVASFGVEAPQAYRILVSGASTQNVKLVEARSNNVSVLRFGVRFGGSVGSFRAAVYHSSDARFDSSDVLVAQKEFGGGKNASAEYQWALASPKNMPLAPSPHTLLVIDPPTAESPGGELPESSEKDNVMEVRPYEVSGAGWCSRFPDAGSLSSLEPGFQKNVRSFIGALKNAKVDVTATRRPYERAWLMYWARQIVHGGQDPRTVPFEPRVLISWAHTDALGRYQEKATRAAASAMLKRYEIGSNPVAEPPKGNHLQGLAVDMNITWKTKVLQVAEPDGTIVTITGRRDGLNPALWKVAKKYGVIKFESVPHKTQQSDPPHWSINGN